MVFRARAKAASSSNADPNGRFGSSRAGTASANLAPLERVRRDRHATLVEPYLIAWHVGLHLGPSGTEGQRQEISDPNEEVLAEKFVEGDRSRGAKVAVAGRFHLDKERRPGRIAAVAAVHVSGMLRDERSGVRCGGQAVDARGQTPRRIASGAVTKSWIRPVASSQTGAASTSRQPLSCSWTARRIASRRADSGKPPARHSLMMRPASAA